MNNTNDNDNDNIGISWKFLIEHITKASFCKKMPDFINFKNNKW